jgi:hypothetical protein
MTRNLKKLKKIVNFYFYFLSFFSGPLDLSLKASQLTAEQACELNKLATKYGIGSGMFFNLMKIDEKEQKDTAEIREIDKASCLSLSVIIFSF